MARVPFAEMVGLVLLATLGGGLATVAAADEKAHVRGINRGGLDAAGLLADGSAHCATIRSALAMLEQSNVIVLVELKDYRAHQRPGVLRYIGTGHGTRYVHIVIFPMATREERIATLAHELQHALEVAAAPDVTDPASLRELYRRIGDEVDDGVFETDRAREAHRQALFDLNTLARKLDKR